MTVPRNALPAPHQPEAALGVQGTAGGVILQNGGLQRPVPGLFGSGAQGTQQLKAQSVPTELLAHIDAYLGHAPVAPAGVYPVQSAPPCQHPAGKNDQAALLCVGSVPRGIGRAFGLEGGVFRGNALNINSGDCAPVLRRHRPDDDLIHTFILGGPKIARILFPLPDKLQYSRICRMVQEADCTEIALTSHLFVIQ